MEKRIYLDNNATTAVDRRVVQAMLPYFSEIYGNPSSVHAFGRETREAVEKAREVVARCLNASPDEIFFTSCGTESDNFAIRGVAFELREKGNHIITSAIEHSAVIKTVKDLANYGFEFTILPVDSYGMVDPDEFRKAIKPNTILATIMLANNEIGTIQPIKELVEIAHEHGVIFHTDAVQGVGKMKVDVQELGVDLLSLSGHKFYAPKGVGALYIRKGTPIRTIQTGGGHERGMRSGTENVPGIVGLGEACRLTIEELDARNERIKRLRDKLEDAILSNPDLDAELNGHPEHRVVNTLNILFRGINAGEAVLEFDKRGVAVSAASACHAKTIAPSHVLLAIGRDPEEAYSSIRFSLGKDNTEEEIDYVISIIPEVIEASKM